MTYLALYRAWRPQTFSDVVGQDHITKTLRNALKENRFSHAYLFSGPRGTGKTSAAKIFAKAVNCESGSKEEPCNDCNICRGITDGSILDVVEIDAASNRGVEEIRELREKVKFTPTEAKYKVYIIDEVHMLTTEAFNALLKTLEEPPAHVVFILATTEPHKLPLTIISRCQRFDFKRISVEIMIERLEKIAKSEGVTIEQNSLSVIARYSEGGMRDALSLLDQVLSYSGDNVSLEDVLRVTGSVSYQVFSQIAKAVFEGDIAKALNIISDLVQDGKEAEKIIEDLLYYYRDILLYKSAPTLEEIKEKVIIDADFPKIAQIYPENQLYEIIESLNKYLIEMKNTSHSLIILELALVRITKLFSNNTQSEHISNIEIEELKAKIKELENKFERLIDNKPQTNKSIKPEEKQTLSNKTNSNSQIIKQLKQFRADFSEENLQKLLKIWPKILQVVKQKKITVHAWLIDGEPVAITNETIILSFNNIMHRDTTDKLSNRQLIEEVVYELIGKKIQVINIMQNDWKNFSSEKILNASNNNKGNSSTDSGNDKEEEELAKKAIELFGEDLVIIKD